MRAFTVATHHEGFLHSLQESARKYGYDLAVLGLNEKWKGFVWRWQVLQEALEDLPDDELVLVLDGYDTVITAPAACLEAEYHTKCDAADRLMFGLEHRKEHCTHAFWWLSEVFRRYHSVGADLPIVNAGVCCGPVRLVRQLCREMQAAAKAAKESKPDDQRILNTLNAQHAADETTGIRVGLLEGLHCHCERSLWGPLRHLYTNVPYIPEGPVEYEDGKVHVRVGDPGARQGAFVARAFVVHGIWCTHLGPICDALGIERPPPADLRKRKISQVDLRIFVDTFRCLFALAIVSGVVALVKRGLVDDY